MHRGFSLIEMMIVLVVIAVLTAIALPSYSNYMRKSARAEAQAFATNLANRQTQYMVDRHLYATSVAQLSATVPATLASKYGFAFATADGPPPTFSITVTAAGDQAHDACPTMTIDSAGNRTPASCW